MRFKNARLKKKHNNNESFRNGFYVFRKVDEVRAT